MVWSSKSTEPSYQNESSDSVSRKPLDGFKIAFNTKAFHWIPQFIAQICSICQFVCPPPSMRQNCINLRDRAEAASAHLCPCCHFYLLSPFEETKWRSKKVIKPWILIENGTFEGFSLKSKLFLYRNKTFWFIKLCSMSKDGRDSATLILMKISHLDRTAL